MAINFEELKQLDPRDPGRWPLPVRLAAILLVFVVVTGGLLYSVVWGGAKDELKGLEDEELRLRDDFRKKHAKAVNLELYKQQLVDIEKSFGAMLRQLPGRTEMQNLLVDISQSGTATGLQQQLFKPMPEQLREFYAEKPIQIRLTGSYHQMGQFVSTIAQLPRIVTLHDFAIKGSGRGNDQLVMDVTAMTYRYLDGNEIATAEAARKKQGAAQ